MTKNMADSVPADLSLIGTNTRDAQVCTSWRKATGRKVNLAEPGNTTVK